MKKCNDSNRVYCMQLIAGDNFKLKKKRQSVNWAYEKHENDDGHARY